MNTIEALRTRRTIRRFDSKEVSRQVLDSIFEAVRFAPSWKNSRTFRFTVITDAKVKSHIAEEATRTPSNNKNIINNAPCVIIQSAVNGKAGYTADGEFDTVKGDGYTMYDAGIAADELCLAAHEYGLGSVIMGLVDYDRIAQIISLPEDETVVTAIAVGYPESIPNPPSKYEVAEYVRYID